MAKNIAASRQKKPGGLSDKVSDIVLVVICAAVMLIVAYPLYYVLVASFSDPYDVYAGKTFLLPSQFTLKGYQAVFADSALFSGFMNSIKYTVIGTIYSVVMIYLVVYPLSVKDLPGRKYISLFFVITMYFGGGLIPTYLIVKDLGLLNKAYTLVVLGSVSVYNLIVTRSFFQSTLPDALFESARIDGASEGRMFFSIALPLSGSILAVMALYYGVARWNEFFNALIYVSNVEYQPLQLVLRSLLLQSQQAVLDAALTNDSEMLADAARLALMAEAMKYAIIFIASAPLLVAYPFVQKHFVKGVMIGALKG